MKKILIFSVAYHPFVGGAEIAVKEITDRMTDVEFHMLTVNLDGKQLPEEKIGNVIVHRIGSGKSSKFLFPFTGYSYARKLMRAHSFDVLWSIMASQASIAASFIKMFDPSLPLVLTIQEGDEESHLARYAFGIHALYKIFVRPWHTLVFRKADHITVISTYLRDRVRNITTHVPIDIIPNGVDTAVFSSEISDVQKDAVIKEIGKAKGDRILITTSRLVEKNGVGDIISALTYLPRSIKLIIIGTGELERQLRIQAELQGMSTRVLFLGFKHHQEIPKYLACADIFIRPSLSEGMGNSFIEAMAAGIPVIATPVGGIPDFLKDKETGLLCRPHDPLDISEKIKDLLADTKLRNHLIKNAQKLVRTKYDWNVITHDMRQVFDMVE